MIRYFVCVLLFILPPSRFFAFRRRALALAGLRIGKDVSVCGHGFVYGRGDFSIGEGTWVSPGTIVRTHPSAPIKIGCNCDIGPCVDFITGSHEISNPKRRAGVGVALPIEIGDGCWIGAHTIILGGVRVGVGCVIAAGSVVACDLPDNVFAAGVPAQVKKHLSE